MKVSTNYLTIAVLPLIVLLVSRALGQGDVQNFYLKDGSLIQGKIVAQDDSTLLVETEYGNLEIRKRDILKHDTGKRLSIEPSPEKTKTIYLEDGTVINGTVVSESEDSLIVDTLQGRISLPKASIVRPIWKRNKKDVDQTSGPSDAERMMLYESKKKSPAKAVLYSCLLPSAGHIYAENKNRGLAFATAKLGFLIVATELGMTKETRGWRGVYWEETHVNGAFYLGIGGFIFMTIVEMADAANEVKKYNERLLREIQPTQHSIGMEFSPLKDGGQLRVTYRF